MRGGTQMAEGLLNTLSATRRKTNIFSVKIGRQTRTVYRSVWKRRDTGSRTEDSEFEREYYNRIAYANQNYAFSSIAGTS